MNSRRVAHAAGQRRTLVPHARRYIGPLTLCALLVNLAAQAQAPAPDRRIALIAYRPSAIVPIEASRRFVTQVVLEDSERILEVAVGDPDSWTIIARRGAHALLIRPGATADHSNLAVTTDKRLYNFDLKVSPAQSDSRLGRPTFRIQFVYASDEANALPAGSSAVSAASVVAGANRAYSMQVMKDSAEIAPDQAYDDARLTYLHFPSHTELPAIFAIAEDHTESLVNLHVEGDWLVLHGIYPQLVLRLGDATVGLWNDAWATHPAALASPAVEVHLDDAAGEFGP